MTTPFPQRQTLRKEIRQRRNALSPREQQLAARRVHERLFEHPRVRAAKRVSLFLSFDGEINTRPLIDTLWQQEKEVYLPVLHPFSKGHLLFLRYEKDSVMTHHPFGILEPRLDVRRVLPVSQLDVIVTPMVAFDAQGNRLGMGGGYYDRTLKDWRKNGSYPIGIAHDCQQVEELTHESWDVPLPEILTPSRHWRWL
ncbi:5-formyltetrahydrofolate cyclo-ligase [Leminorella grimontii]|uniref:5-formyltetrahydrofolate cyclo-ligase n=1 Tax=Leminorella grimontii TaxID=82981 RepID=UPI0020818413|nr:5-formyltetrahydrofolate cyclo-ligase [Leminorella grimontii]GKX60991.1 5-formyltetrahydrofolate cyclo-ligase [Leminorella grimontii]